MSGVRQYLRTLAAAAICLQTLFLSAFIANDCCRPAPSKIVHASGDAQEAAGAACPMKHEDGAACPMHRQRGSDCTMRAGCASDGAALAALLVEIAPTQARFALLADVSSQYLVTRSDPALVSSDSSLDPPPPR